MHVEQFVMAYGVEQDRLRAILPEGFSSLRPVLRINAEIRDGKTGYLEFNTAVQKGGLRGWLNIGFWDDVPFVREGKTIRFCADFLEIEFTDVSLGKTLPAVPSDVQTVYPKEPCTARNAANIPCTQVLGTYMVQFER